MQKLFENWNKFLKEDNIVPIRPGIERESIPKVECHCECHDCIFNKNYQCVAEKIKLDFAQTSEGKWICECLTYEVPKKEKTGPDNKEEHEAMLARKWEEEEHEARDPGYSRKTELEES